jgi:DNA repair protein RadC
MTSPSIHESPASRFQERGADALTDAELLSVSAQIPLGDCLSLIDAFGGSLRRVFASSIEDLEHHLTAKQAARLKTIFHLQSRTIEEKIADRSFVECSHDVVDLLSHKFAALDQEVFSVVFLNTKHRVIRIEELFRGTIDSASIYPREIVKRALALGSSGIIAVHNHPSGNPEPSREDQRLTHELRDACKLVEVVLLDHVVIGSPEYYSFAEKGLM